jgi:hypothetical protein
VLIGLQRRQVFRLLRGLKQDGATSLLSKHRGKPAADRCVVFVNEFDIRQFADPALSRGFLFVR